MLVLPTVSLAQTKDLTVAAYDDTTRSIALCGGVDYDTLQRELEGCLVDHFQSTTLWAMAYCKESLCIQAL